MTNQQLSILFETISFFFVAIDLYGRDRLERTHDRLLIILDKITSIIEYIRDFDWSKSRSSKLMMFTYVLSGVGTMYLFFVQFPIGWDDLSFGKVLTMILPVIFLFGFAFGIILVGLLLAMSLLIFSSLAMAWIIKIIFYGLSQLLRTINFEGLLLVIGSMMFVISKFLQLF
jgi:hypothetical protein